MSKIIDDLLTLESLVDMIHAYGKLYQRVGSCSDENFSELLEEVADKIKTSLTLLNDIQEKVETEEAIDELGILLQRVYTVTGKVEKDFHKDLVDNIYQTTLKFVKG